MSRSKYMSNRLREVFLDGHWIANTNYKEQLSALTWEQATEKVGDLNTIAMLTFHINYYVNGLLHVFNTGKLEISDKYSFDMAPIRNASDWKNLLSQFMENAGNFADMVERLPESRFDEVFVEEKYGSFLRNIEAIIEHSYYHLGQISLIRKVVTSKQLTK